MFNDTVVIAVLLLFAAEILVFLWMFALLGWDKWQSWRLACRLKRWKHYRPPTTFERITRG